MTKTLLFLIFIFSFNSFAGFGGSRGGGGFRSSGGSFRSSSSSFRSSGSTFGGSRSSGSATIVRPNRSGGYYNPSQPTVVHQTIVHQNSGGSFLQNWAMWHLITGGNQQPVVINNGQPSNGQPMDQQVQYESHSIFYYIFWGLFQLSIIGFIGWFIFCWITDRTIYGERK